MFLSNIKQICFKNGTHSCKFFGRLGTSIYLHPVWAFSNNFLFPKVLSLKSFERFWEKFLYNSAVMPLWCEDWLLVWELDDLTWFNVMRCTPFSKTVGEKIFLWRSENFDFKEELCYGAGWGGYMEFLEKLENCIIVVWKNN